MSDALGTVASLARFPVKSMQGERLVAGDLTGAGVVGDRAYALIDTATGKVMSAKHPRLGTRLLACRATFTDPFGPYEEVPPVRITLPDQTVVTSDSPDADSLLSAYLGLDVRLQRAASVPTGPFLDAFPVSVLSTSTLGHLQSLARESRFDPRRFRMNVIVDGPEDGFVEQGWLGRSIRIGRQAQITVRMPDPRCVMTTLAQEDLPRDKGVLQALVRHNRLEVGDGLYPCAGVYAVVDAPGPLGQGDQLALV